MSYLLLITIALFSICNYNSEKSFSQWFGEQYTWKGTGRAKVGEESHLPIKLAEL